MPALAHASVCAAPEASAAEERLVALARSGAPLRRALAAVAGRLVAGRAWERLGFVRPRDYAVERAGLSARQLQDLAHVDAALRGLPAVDAAFVAGRLTWTKARLLCRVATPADAAAWVSAAEGMTARALAREVRRLDARALEAGGADEDGAPEEPRETVRLRVTPPVAGRWSRARLLACRAAGETLPVAAVAEAVAAEVMSAFALEVDPGSATPLTAPLPGAPTPVSRANGCASHGGSGALPMPAPALPAFLAPLVQGLDAADAFELDARLLRAIRLEQRLLAEMGPLLLEVARTRRNVAGFAREALGMSPRKAQMLLRLERACALAPVLRGAYRAGRLSWLQAHALIPRVAAGGDAAAWVAHAQRVSVRRLLGDLDDAAAAATVAAQTGARATPSEGTVPLFFTVPRDVARLFRAVLATVQRRIERRASRPATQSEALGAMLAHCFETWGLGHEKVPREHRVFERDGWRCTVPGCSSYRNLHDHHIRFRSAGGSDALANRTTLCAAHHLRGVHAGLVRIRGRAPHGLRFEMGLRPGRSPLVAYGPGEVLLDAARASVGR
jgi:hypothetical protein